MIAPLLILALASPPSTMFGGDPSRNMVSNEKDLPDDWDLGSGRNVVWSAKLGSQAYGGPVVGNGVALMGSNNENPRDPGQLGDKGVLMAFDARTGAFLWQSVHDKLAAGRVNDWPLQGVCSTSSIVDDRVYYVSNRAEVVAADLHGFRDGENDGPFAAEANAGDDKADLTWTFDMIAELDVFPHNLAAGSPLIVEDRLFTVTGNGVDEGHINIPAPKAPSFIALDRHTGKLLWESALPGEKILHGSWSNPAYAVIGNRAQVMFPGGDGWLYSFDPVTGKLWWRFDCNPKDSKWELGGSGTRNNIISTPVIADGRVHISVGQDPEHGEGIGHLWAIDASGSGDITDTGAVWHRGGKDYHRSISTVAIAGAELYAADLSGNLYCLDARTGAFHWKHEMHAAVWGSPFVADGKVYLGDEDGDVAIFKAGTTKSLIREINMGNSVYTTPVANDGMLYLATRSHLYALRKASTRPVAPATRPTKP